MHFYDCDEIGMAVAGSYLSGAYFLLCKCHRPMCSYSLNSFACNQCDSESDCAKTCGDSDEGKCQCKKRPEC